MTVRPEMIHDPPVAMAPPFGVKPGWWHHGPGVVVVMVWAILLAGLSLAAVGPTTIGWDRTIQRRVLTLDGAGWDGVAVVGNRLGETLVGLVILAAVSVLLLVRRRLPEAAFLGGVALIRTLNWPLKWLHDSPRPATTGQGTNDVAPGLGYPSGHAMGTMLIGVALVVVVFRLTGSRVARAGAVVTATGVILGTGFGRVVSQAHWPSDVIGGWLWGGALLGVVVVLVRAADRRRPMRYVADPSHPEHAEAPSD